MASGRYQNQRARACVRADCGLDQRFVGRRSCLIRASCSTDFYVRLIPQPLFLGLFAGEVQIRLRHADRDIPRSARLANEPPGCAVLRRPVVDRPDQVHGRPTRLRRSIRVA